MPWTGNELHVARWDNGCILDEKHVAGKSDFETICQPRWNIDSTLYFVSDKTGFWQLYTWNVVSSVMQQLNVPHFEDADFAIKEGRLGKQVYSHARNQKVVLTYV